MNTVGGVIARVKRKKLCKHALGTRHCGNPKCPYYIGRAKT